MFRINSREKHKAIKRKLWCRHIYSQYMSVGTDGVKGTIKPGLQATDYKWNYWIEISVISQGLYRNGVLFCSCCLLLTGLEIKMALCLLACRNHPWQSFIFVYWWTRLPSNNKTILKKRFMQNVHTCYSVTKSIKLDCVNLLYIID